MVNFKLDAPASASSTLSGTSYQLKTLDEDLPAKLLALLASRIWKPSGSTRRPEIGDLVLVRDAEAAREVGRRLGVRVVGKLGCITRDDKDGQPYRLKIMDDPFGPPVVDAGPLKQADLTLVGRSASNHDPPSDRLRPGCCRSLYPARGADAPRITTRTRIG